MEWFLGHAGPLCAEVRTYVARVRTCEHGFLALLEGEVSTLAKLQTICPAMGRPFAAQKRIYCGSGRATLTPLQQTLGAVSKRLRCLSIVVSLPHGQRTVLCIAGLPSERVTRQGLEQLQELRG